MVVVRRPLAGALDAERRDRQPAFDQAGVGHRSFVWGRAFGTGPRAPETGVLRCLRPPASSPRPSGPQGRDAPGPRRTTNVSLVRRDENAAERQRHRVVRGVVEGGVVEGDLVRHGERHGLCSPLRVQPRFCHAEVRERREQLVGLIGKPPRQRVAHLVDPTVAGRLVRRRCSPLRHAAPAPRRCPVRRRPEGPT